MTARRGVLELLAPPSPVPAAPPDRGRLMTAAQVAHELLSSTVKPGWVTRYLTAGRVRLGRCTIRWWEREVQAWLETRAQRRPD